MGSPKVSGRKKVPLQDPQSFMFINLPFCSLEELIELIIKIREKEKAEFPHAIIIFPGMKYGSIGIQVSSQKVRLKV